MFKELLLSSIISFSVSVRTPNDDTKQLDYKYTKKAEKNEGKLKEMKVNKSKVNKAYTGVLNHMRKVVKKLNDDEMYEVTTQLKKWFNKNIM